MLPLVSLLRISSQRFVWFAMFCRQTEAVKRKVRKTEHLYNTYNTCQLESRNTDPLERKLTYGWMFITEILFFALLKVSGNRQSFACFTLPSAKNQRRFGKEIKVAVSKFS